MNQDDFDSLQWLNRVESGFVTAMGGDEAICRELASGGSTKEITKRDAIRIMIRYKPDHSETAPRDMAVIGAILYPPSLSHDNQNHISPASAGFFFSVSK